MFACLLFQCCVISVWFTANYLIDRKLYKSLISGTIASLLLYLSYLDFTLKTSENIGLGQITKVVNGSIFNASISVICDGKVYFCHSDDVIKDKDVLVIKIRYPITGYVEYNVVERFSTP